MLGISTSWKSSDLQNGEDLYQAIQQLPISSVELEYRITDVMFHQLRGLLTQSQTRAVSIHNFFPIPPMVSRSAASGDLFLLSSPDDEERNLAVKWTQRTIECANDMEVEVVVLHCGRIDMEAEMDTLHHFLEKDMIDSEEAQEFIRKKLIQREEKKPKFFDALLFSLDKLIKTAEAYDVLLGLENRYFYYELPGPDEFQVLFKEFEGGPLRYWHDVGHAGVNEAFSFVSQKALLERYSSYLIGIHYHDVKGYNDHLPPGQGSVDFASIKGLVNDHAIEILELKPGTPDLQVVEGIDFLREQGIS